MPKILFICTANLCRSPMAAALMRRKLNAENLSDWHVGSAGTWARDGNPAPEYGRRLMASVGMDIAHHRSRIVTAEILDDADLILTMEEGHKEALRAEFPSAGPRVFLLSEMAGFPQSIADPYGGPFEGWRETAKEINQFIEQGFEKILQLAQEGARSKNG